MFADRDRPRRIAHSRDFLDTDSANGCRGELIWDMPIKRSPQVWQKRGFKSEILDNGTELVDIAWCQMAARQHVDAGCIPARQIAGFVDKHLDHPGNCFLPAILKRILEIRGRDIDQWKSSESRIFLPNELDISFDVIALRFRHTGGTNTNQFRLCPIVNIQIWPARHSQSPRERWQPRSSRLFAAG